MGAQTMTMAKANVKAKTKAKSTAIGSLQLNKTGAVVKNCPVLKCPTPILYPPGLESPAPGGNSFYDCCIIPLRYVLDQLIGQPVQIGLEANTPGQYTNAIIKSVNRGTVVITVEGKDMVLSLYHVVGVESPLILDIKLLQPPTIPRNGAGMYLEAPFRQFFNTIIDDTVDIITMSTGSSFKSIQNALITRTGEGIVVLNCSESGQTYMVLSLAKIQEVSNYGSA